MPVGFTKSPKPCTPLSPGQLGVLLDKLPSESIQTRSVVARADILSHSPEREDSCHFLYLDRGVVCLGVGFSSPSFSTGSKNICAKIKMTEYKKIWSSSFRGLGIVVWKFNTKDLFSEASGTGRDHEDERGRGMGK